jgi:hypothetical protein
VDREGREGRLPKDEDLDEDFTLEWRRGDDPATRVVEDALEASPEDDVQPAPSAPAGQQEPSAAIPWSAADETAPQFLSDPEPAAAPHPDDEAPPHGDPLDETADHVYAGERPAPRMDSLQEALSSIRERVQSLSTSMQSEAGAGAGTYARTSELSLYRQATDNRTLAELRRHSGETEELLRRMGSLMQDLSLDLRSIVDAARRAIDQTSEQAESSVELGRLIGERIEQIDEQLGARLDVVNHALAQRVDKVNSALSQGLDKVNSAVTNRLDNVDSAVANLLAHLDTRLTKLEQRSGVGVLREEMGELRADMGDVRAELGDVRGDLGGLRDEVGAVADSGGAELRDRLETVGGQLDRTLATLTELVEGVPEQDEAVVDGVVSAIKAETEAAVEPFRVEVEELGRQMGEAIEREEQLGATLVVLTEEVQRLRKRIAVRAAPPTIDADQIQSIVDAVVAALPGAQTPSRPARARPVRAPEPEPDADADLDVEPEPAPPRRERPVRARRAKKAPAPRRAAVPDEADDFASRRAAIVEPEPESFEDEEEPIRRARGAGRKADRPLVKGRRARSSSR